jgi:hypothetical protein
MLSEWELWRGDVFDRRLCADGAPAKRRRSIDDRCRDRCGLLRGRAVAALRVSAHGDQTRVFSRGTDLVIREIAEQLHGAACALPDAQSSYSREIAGHRCSLEQPAHFGLHLESTPGAWLLR